MNVLLIRFSSLGDVVLASAAVRALSESDPTARITLLTKQAYAPLFREDDRIAHLTAIDRGTPLHRIPALLGGRRFDAVVDLHGSLRSRAVGVLVPARLKTRIRKHAIGRRIMVLSRNRYRRTFDALGSYLEALRPLGVTSRVLPELRPSPEMLADAAVLLADRVGADRPFVGIAPGARHEAKRWNEASFAAVADGCTDAGRIPVFLGNGADREVIDRIRSLMRREAVSFAGEIDLALTMGVIARLDMVLTNDSGPMHLAGALGTPCVTVFGPTHPDLGFCPGYPKGIVLHSGRGCSPCGIHGGTDCRYGQRRCMDDITPEQVLAALEACG